MRIGLRAAFALLALLGIAYAAMTITVVKTPYEQFTCYLDFTPEALAEGGAGANDITLLSVTSFNVNTGINTTSTIVSTSPPPALIGGSDKIQFRVQNGQLGETHQINVQVTDNNTGDQFEGSMLINISNK